MSKSIQTEVLYVADMSCAHCERKIEGQLKETPGVYDARASFTDGTVRITYDADVTDVDAIKKIIEELDYHFTDERHTPAVFVNILRLLCIAAVLYGLYAIAKRLGLLNFLYDFPEAREGMGYGMLFFVGLLTSAHCIGMCGGINMSQTLSRSPQSTQATPGAFARFAVIRPGVLYNLGRVASYTLVGGAIGLLGAAVSPSEGFKIGVQIAAGVFMIIMGLNMLNLFSWPWLRRLSPRMPRFAVSLADKIRAGKSRGPFYVGLLNGFMPCGPLQAMQLYALGTGSFIKGALSMFCFSAGTLPLMFGLSALSSIMSKKFARTMATAGAVMVILMGTGMLGNGMNLAGFSLGSAFARDGVAQGGSAVQQNKVQLVRTELGPFSYEPITVQVGIPVRWTINAKPGMLNGCNNRFIIPEFDNLQKQLVIGENLVEFTPLETGTIIYTCWMGMIGGKITIVEENPSIEIVEMGTNS